MTWVTDAGVAGVYFLLAVGVLFGLACGTTIGMRFGGWIYAKLKRSEKIG